MYSKVLVPIDLGDLESAGKALNAAEKMPLGSDGEIHVLTVVPTYGMSIVGSYFGEEFEEKAIEGSRASLQSYLEGRDNALSVKGHVAHGSIYDEIMRVANELTCDLIVMSAHRPDLRDYLLGPNAARVVRHAKQTVLVVRD